MQIRNVTEEKIWDVPQLIAVQAPETTNRSHYITTFMRR